MVVARGIAEAPRLAEAVAALHLLSPSFLTHRDACGQSRPVCPVQR